MGKRRYSVLSQSSNAHATMGIRMSDEPESFLARWSRRKRKAERDTERPADTAPQDQTPAKLAGAAAAESAPVAASASAAAAREPVPTNEVPLPPIESLDGLRSDYQAFFQQPVDDKLRHAALKKLFADPHFNKMDMLDVYVDDYTQFEPLPAAMRLRLPSARAFLSDLERAALEASEAESAGNALETAAAQARAATAPPAENPENPQNPDSPLDVASSPAEQPAKSTASDPPSS